MTENTWLKKIGRHLNDVNVNRLRKVLADVDEHYGSVRWEVRPCSKPLNPDDEDPWNACWCAMVFVEGSKDKEAWIVPSGSLSRHDAEFLVTLHNAAPAICELRELLEQPTWCGRCGRDDLKLWMYHEHIIGCTGLTEEINTIQDLKDELERLRGELSRTSDALDDAKWSLSPT